MTQKCNTAYPLDVSQSLWRQHRTNHMYACMHVMYACMQAYISCMHACMYACMYVSISYIHSTNVSLNISPPASCALPAFVMVSAAGCRLIVYQICLFLEPSSELLYCSCNGSVGRVASLAGRQPTPRLHSSSQYNLASPATPDSTPVVNTASLAETKSDVERN